MAAVGYCFGGRCVLTRTPTRTPTLGGASSTWHRANPDLTLTLTLTLALALALTLTLALTLSLARTLTVAPRVVWGVAGESQSSGA